MDLRAGQLCSTSSTTTIIKNFHCCLSLLRKPQTRHSPIIVGDHYELAETLALQYSGEAQGNMLVKAAALLPMSGYDKFQKTNVNEYDRERPSQAYYSLLEYNARRPLRSPGCLQNTLTDAADPHFQQPSTSHDRQSDHMNYRASAIYQPRAKFEVPPSTYQNFELHEALQVSDYTPKSGTQGSRVSIDLNSSTDLLSSTHTIAALMFATYSVPAALTFTRLEARDQNVWYKYSVSAIAPAFSETGSLNLQVPLSLQLQGQSRLDGGFVNMGGWTYEHGKQVQHCSSPQQVSRKRKVADELSDTPRSTKRISPSEQQAIQSQEYGSNPYLPKGLQGMEFSRMQRRYTPYGRSQLQQSPQNKSNIMRSLDLLGDASDSQSLGSHPMSQTSSWNSSYGANLQSGRNSQSTVSQSFPISSVSASTPKNPSLIRTSLIPHPSSGSTSACSSSSDGNFTSHTFYPCPVVLEIRGNLSAMQANWTSEERAMKRRIVRFWREQSGAILSAYFKPVRADEQPLPHEVNERRISCIYWEERNEYFITSVDTISLLESLIGYCFHTNEKNRIRRNLDCYKACTVSKGKPDSESFFELLMGLPDPRPRAIHKSVKVFKWDILGKALEKIFSKYSVDPSSTGDFSGTQSEGDASLYSALSPRSTSGSTASIAYSQQRNKSSTLSPPSVAHSLPSYSQASPLQQYSAPSFAHSYAAQPLGPQYIPNDSFNSSYATQVSIPSLSSTYTASTIGRRRSRNAPTEDMLAPTDYYLTPPHTNSTFTSQYPSQESSEARATLGLPGRASLDLSTYLNTDVTSAGGIGDAQYRRDLGASDEREMHQFKQEPFKQE